MAQPSWSTAYGPGGAARTPDLGYEAEGVSSVPMMSPALELFSCDDHVGTPFRVYPMNAMGATDASAYELTKALGSPHLSSRNLALGRWAIGRRMETT